LAIKIDPTYTKEHYRRAVANMELCRLEMPFEIFEYNTNAEAGLKKCEKIVDHKSILDSLDLDSIKSSYDGPKLQNDKITLEFVKEMLDYFKDQRKFIKNMHIRLFYQVRNLMLKVSSLVDIDIPKDSKITVCGDIHGQFYDLLNIFDLNGLPSTNNMYFFNGGNHETDDMNKMYGFEGEVNVKYSKEMFELFVETFTTQWIVGHDDVTLDEIRKVNRFNSQQINNESLTCEICDSQILPGRSPSKRRLGVQFGPDVTKNFLKRNNLVKENGYVIEHNGKCITVFSAPNY
ncbi:14851_t:CDS:10, partial [Entrophospora sp. SA101]